MGSKFSSEHKDLIYLTTLFRAKLSQQLSLKHNISDMIIRSNYNKTNPSPKHEQESIHVSKIIARKIIEIHKLNATLHHIKRRRTVNRRNSKFLNVLDINPTHTFARFQESREDPESMIMEEFNGVKRLNSHFQSLLSYLNLQKDRFIENLSKIEENAKKALALAKARTEITDLKHYKSYLQAHKQFLGDQKTIKISERKIFIRTNSMKFSNKLYLLKKSRILIDEYEEKVRVLKERTCNKMECLMIEHEKVIGNFKNGGGDLSPSIDLQRKLAALTKKEEFIKEKLAFWKRQRGMMDNSESTGEFLSKEESIKKDEDKSEEVKKQIEKKRTDTFEDEWMKYNLKFNTSMDFFNQITSRSLQVLTK